jgi:alpha-1,3-rhamnosyl/mannosyltransferase
VAKRADGLIAISENTRRDAVRILGLAPERIRVIYPGVAESFFDTRPEQARQVKEKYALRRPYILFVGTVEPRKNVDLLLDAYQQLAPSLRGEFDLVLAGPSGWASWNTLDRLRAKPPGVRYLGYVPEADLPALTSGATVFAYLPLYEGFGFPVAQAMAAGVPVLTSNLSSLPEITGDAALLVDPRSLHEAGAALERLLLSPSLRAEGGKKGARRAGRYRWKGCALDSLRFFNDIGGT